jgi:2-amino-4-hydroxy-6-hydroxymethyldihydropteridine diphosphokinase
VLRWKLRKAGLNYSKSIAEKKKDNTNLAFIALGSNKGDRISFLRQAILHLKSDPKVQFAASSSVYETKPFGNINQSDFLNAVIEVKTTYSPIRLFYCLKNIETKLGRSETKKWGPREIDLDLLFFNDRILKNKKLRVPHVGIQDRDFVLIPLKEIAPEYVHPVLKEKISDICIENITKNIIRKTRLKLTSN